MAQLVGRTCTICRERIPDELDARFCSDCCNPVHAECANNTPRTAGACQSCGTDFRTADRVQAAEHKKREAAIDRGAVPPQMELERALHSAGRAYRMARWILGGCAVIVVGLLLMTDPKMRSNPRELGSGEIAAGAAAILVGVVLIGLGFLEKASTD